MTVKEFWEQMDYLEASHQRGTIDSKQFSIECVLLGWKWHAKTGDSLPIRPRETSK